ncbi:Ig-like domain-containing protein [Nocardioides sp. SYSU D00065]|uniref:Ig-like domain-containing protein n=1 Tax=Nocardioides sp. SYSU D00065 TaxID=2817378 RepID=UPI001B344744|nr:Ig-like domain repeat protein [Nocardioides sp. SYSU D00065]
MKHAHSGARCSAGSVAALALVAGATAVLAGPAPAQAATTTIVDAELRWEINKESLSGAFAPGTWNLLSAGRLGNPGAGGQTLRSTDAGATWANGAPAGWTNTAGNVTVLDKQGDGSYAPTTWLGTRTNAAGQLTSGASHTVNSENLLSLTEGTGTVDPVTDTGTLAWDGDFTVVYYSGMSFFYVSDPRLTLTNGTGKLTATLSGYGSDQADQSTWTPLPDTEVTLADVSGVDLTDSGLTATPAYREVVYDGATSTPQVRTGMSWGSFPSSFVDFQQGVGTASYWYSSGGSADPRKVASPFSVAYSQPGQARVTVSDTTLLPSGAHQVTVEGAGFDPDLATGTRPPLAGRPAGAYIAFGRYADHWRPSAGAPASSRVNAGGAGLKWAVSAADAAAVGGPAAGAVELRPDGTFTATLTVDKSVVDAKTSTGTYGIYTYLGSGAVQPAYETFTPITFARSTPEVSIAAANVTYGADAPVTVTVSSPSSSPSPSSSRSPATGTVTLTDGTTVVGSASLVDGKAAFTLARPTAGQHRLTATYSGDGDTEAGEASRTVTVAKAVPAVRVTAGDPDAGEDVVVSVGLPAAATGTVVLKEDGTVLGTATVAAGSATLALGDLGAGEHALVATYGGDANHEASSGTTRVNVVRVAGRAKVRWAAKPTAGKRGKAVVAVSALAGGKTTAVVRTARGRKVEALTARIRGAKVTFTLPRLARGAYTLVVRVPGNDDVAPVTTRRTFRVA